MKPYKPLIQENTEDDFKKVYWKRIGNALNSLLKMSEILKKADESTWKKINKILKVYDVNVEKKIVQWATSPYSVNKQDIIKFAINNFNRYGTEPHMILDAIENLKNMLIK
jgi:hypothetical protein